MKTVCSFFGPLGIFPDVSVHAPPAGPVVTSRHRVQNWLTVIYWTSLPTVAQINRQTENTAEEQKHLTRPWDVCNLTEYDVWLLWQQSHCVDGERKNLPRTKYPRKEYPLKTSVCIRGDFVLGIFSQRHINIFSGGLSPGEFYSAGFCLRGLCPGFA